MSFTEHARPFLTFHVGQAGLQIGHAIWELLCLEHNIDPDGKAKPECQGNGLYNSMFLRNASGHFMPRSILVDTDPTCIDEVRVGPYRELFSANQLLSDHCDTGNNYMLGRHGFNNRLVPDTLERFRSLLEKTETTPGIFLIHSIGGGTGSGLATSCLETLHGELGSSLDVIEVNVTSGRTGLQNSCETINQVLYLYESRDFTNVSFTVTNSAMYNVCRSGLNMTNATYTHLNRILAMCFSNITAMERFPGTIPCTVRGICNNVRPFKHLKNLVLACAPFLPNDVASKERINTIGISSSVMDAESQMADVDLCHGRHMAGVLLFRGAAKPTDVEQAVTALRGKGKIEFVDWAPPSFKTGLIELPPLAVPSSGIGAIPLSVTLISSHTSIASLFGGKTDIIKKLSPGGYFLQKYNVAIGEVSSGHNSDIANLLQEACNHMDSITKVYESERGPDFGTAPAQPQQEVEDERTEKKARPEDIRKRAKQELGGLASVKKIGSEDIKLINSKPVQLDADVMTITQDPVKNVNSEDSKSIESQSVQLDADVVTITQDPVKKVSSEDSKSTTSEVTPDPAKKSSGGGCCKKSDNKQRPPERKGSKGRSESQNQANSELHGRFGSTSTESESFRSTNYADIECFINRSRAQSPQSLRHRLEDFSNVSTRCTDSEEELSDIIQNSLLCQPLQTNRTISAARQIIQKYNQMFK